VLLIEGNIVLKSRLCDIDILYAHSPTEEKSDDLKITAFMTSQSQISIIFVKYC
jgi:hypothetical protein